MEAEDEINNRQLLENRVSSHSETDNTVVMCETSTGTASNKTEPFSQRDAVPLGSAGPSPGYQLAKPVRSHPPLRRHANFNYKPPEIVRTRPRHISSVHEEDEKESEEVHSSAYERVWLSESQSEPGLGRKTAELGAHVLSTCREKQTSTKEYE